MAKKKVVNIHRQNPPDWFQQSDFGIFIHWGMATIPAYAPVDVPDYGQMAVTMSPEEMFTNIPYVEWYQNSLRIAGSPVQKYHREHYGDQPYTEFAAEFRERAKNVDVEHWMALCARTGAKYVVAVTKHHDGFVLYDTKVKNPNIDNYHFDFDYIGDLARACRKNGMRFGVYYSSLLDWTFTDRPITSASGLLLSNDNSRRYMDYCYAHWMELIDRYEPDVLWSDIGYPADKRLPELFKYYYSKVPEGVVNDRWGQFPNFLRNAIGRAIVDKAAAKILKSGASEPLDTPYFDYRTIEYTSKWKDNGLYFEMCRGMDKSFGYNQYSRPEDYITPEEVKAIVAEIYPKKGRLLLNFGPDSYGTIPPFQEQILKELEGAFHG